MPKGPAEEWVRALERQVHVRHLSPRTAQAYGGWTRRFLGFHGHRDPRTMGAEEVRRFLTHLAVVERVSASTQNQATAALLFLYRDVLGRDLDRPKRVVRAKRGPRRPEVLTRGEVRRVLRELSVAGNGK